MNEVLLRVGTGIVVTMISYVVLNTASTQPSVVWKALIAACLGLIVAWQGTKLIGRRASLRTTKVGTDIKGDNVSVKRVGLETDQATKIEVGIDLDAKGDVQVSDVRIKQGGRDDQAAHRPD